MWENRKKVGIMGGTFDPIHIGHLILGEIAYEQFQLDKVLFMPAGNPPHKKNRKDGASNQQRVEMVKRAIASNPHFELSLVEMDKTTYTHTSHERLNNRISLLEEKYHGRIEKMNSPTIDIASKELRARIAEGNPIIYYVPDEVAAYIRENNIYKDCDKDEI